MNKLWIVLIAGSVFVTNCGKNATPSFEPESYSGELTVSRVELVYTRTDTVTLVVDGSSYQLFHLTRASKLCNSHGTQSGFGTNSLRLTPVSNGATSCDNLRVPAGIFSAVFSGESLTLGPTRIHFTVDVNGQSVEESWDYTFKLHK